MNTLLMNLSLASIGGLAGTWLLAALLRKQSAACRHLVWSVGFVAVLLGWVLMANSWRLELAWLPDRNLAVNYDTAVELAATGDGMAKQPLTVKPVAKRVDWLGLFWLSGAGVCLLPLVAGWWRTRGLHKRARVVGTDEELSQLAARIYAGMNRHCRLKVLLSDEAMMPLTGGVFGPFVILPSEAQEWTELRLWRVFTHEIGHQVRHDFVWSLFARALCALCWFNPLAWYAARRQRIEAEMACDDLVVSAGDAAEGYAEDLLQLLREFPQGLDTPLVSSMARQSQIKVRLQSMLNVAANRRPLGWLAKYGMVISVLLLVFTLATVRVVHAAGTKIDDNKVTSPAAEVKDKLIEISMKLFSVPKDSPILQLAEFKQACAAGDVGKTMSILENAGADLISEPRVTVFPGQRVKIRSVGELRYPTEWDDAATPTHFAQKNVGATLNVKPGLKDGRITLDAILESIIFLGFNRTGGTDEMPILVPMFEVKAKALACNLKDGESVVEWLPEPTVRERKEAVLITVRLVDKAPVQSVAEKLESIVIPKVDFVDEDISEVLNYLQDQSKVLDPLKQGVNFVFKDKPSTIDKDHSWQEERTLTLNLRNLPLKKILDFMQTLCSYKYKVEKECVYVFPNIEAGEVMLVRTFLIPRHFLSEPAMAGAASADVKKELSDKGIEFLPGASAAYLPKAGKLVVRNTAEQLDKIEKLLKE
jgi:beta-lactamase regulating signal transducer with metallopeptidase domain